MTHRVKKIPKIRGFSALLFTFIVLASVSLLTVISFNQMQTRQSSVLSTVHLQNAFLAAQSGLDYAIPFLDENYDALYNGQKIDLNIGNGNRAVLYIEFQSGKDEIKIISTGYTKDDVYTYSVSQNFRRLSVDSHLGSSTAIYSRNDMQMSGGSSLHDHEYGLYTAILGGNARMMYPSYTFIHEDRNPSSVGSGRMGGDIVEYDSDVQGLSDEALTLATLGVKRSEYEQVNIDGVESKVNVVYTPSGRRGGYTASYGDYNYIGEFNAHSGEGLEIVQTQGNAMIANGRVGEKENGKNAVFELREGSNAILQNTQLYGDVVVRGGNLVVQSDVEVHGNVVVDGSVTLNESSVVNGAVIATGNVNITNNTRVYGLVFALGNINVADSSEIHGAAVSGQTVALSNNSSIHYYANYAMIQFPAGYTSNLGYAKVPGSWTDTASL